MFRFLELFPWRLVRRSDMVKLKYDSWMTGHIDGFTLREKAGDIVSDLNDGKTVLLLSKKSPTTITPDGKFTVQLRDFSDGDATYFP